MRTAHASARSRGQRKSPSPLMLGLGEHPVVRSNLGLRDMCPACLAVFYSFVLILPRPRARSLPSSATGGKGSPPGIAPRTARLFSPPLPRPSLPIFTTLPLPPHFADRLLRNSLHALLHCHQLFSCLLPPLPSSSQVSRALYSRQSCEDRIPDPPEGRGGLLLHQSCSNRGSLCAAARGGVVSRRSGLGHLLAMGAAGRC